MARLTVECLRCGDTRDTNVDPGECPRCSYLGWAPSRDLTELARRALRERPVERRRLRLVA